MNDYPLTMLDEKEPTRPTNPCIGQLWVEPKDGENVLKVYNGEDWIFLARVVQNPISGEWEARRE